MIGGLARYLWDSTGANGDGRTTLGCLVLLIATVSLFDESKSLFHLLLAADELGKQTGESSLQNV